VPFELRLLNGMNRPVLEVRVLIHKVTKDRRIAVLVNASCTSRKSGIQTLGQAAAERSALADTVYEILLANGPQKNGRSPRLAAIECLDCYNGYRGGYVFLLFQVL